MVNKSWSLFHAESGNRFLAARIVQASEAVPQRALSGGERLFANDPERLLLAALQATKEIEMTPKFLEGSACLDGSLKQSLFFRHVFCFHCFAIC